ncbi:MAG: hypothetical protein NWQ95_00910 [Verrucomicrobiales bacterium]|nr:hypothetical protein [Verrucomicrobiales bacterium]
MIEENATDRLKIKKLFCFDGKEAIGEEEAHRKGQFRAILRRLLGQRALQLLVGKRPHFPEIIEDLANRRSGEVIHSQFLTKMFVFEEFFRNLLCLQGGQSGTRRKKGKNKDQQDRIGEGHDGLAESAAPQKKKFRSDKREC